MPSKAIVVTPWHNSEQLNLFLAAWGIRDLSKIPDWLYLQQDKDRSGCARTKNAGIRRALDDGADFVVVLDDDCFPQGSYAVGLLGVLGLEALVQQHLRCLQPAEVELFEVVTNPPSRGTPYHTRTVKMPVAASMGFWTGVGDYDAPGQLIHGQTKPMEFQMRPVFGKYFPLCGMNLAFPASAWPWCQFVNVPRFDDIWQGFLWQKHAYSLGQCFNLAGPLVRHARQSNVWANLRAEATNLEVNETLWKRIHDCVLIGHSDLLKHFGLTV
jgi:hypothetical protein